MPALVQNLRTPTATSLPATLEPGQIAFNLANDWMMLGDGSAEITVDGTPVGSYGATATILGVAGVNVPAKPAAGKGYSIHSLIGAVPGTAAVYSITDDLVNTAAGATTADKIVAALTTRGDITGAGDLNTGDQVLLTPGTGSPFAGIDLGGYLYDGAALQRASSDVFLHTLGDVADTALATVTSANVKGILVRDSTVADGAAGAYKLVSVLDLGTF